AERPGRSDPTSHELLRDRDEVGRDKGAGKEGDGRVKDRGDAPRLRHAEDARTDQDKAEKDRKDKKGLTGKKAPQVWQRDRRQPPSPGWRRSSSSATWTPTTGADSRRPASSPRPGRRDLRGRRPRPDRPGPAGARRRQHLPRPGLPHPAQGLQPRPDRLRGAA